MRLAIEEARKGIAKGQTPFGACIVRRNELIARAHNHVWQNTDITAHAEIHAIRMACRKLRSIDLSGCIIYSTCEPCPMCFSACHWAKISSIIYGANIPDALRAGFHELSVSNVILKKLGKSSIKIVGGFLKEESVGLFKEWGRSKSRKVY